MKKPKRGRITSEFSAREKFGRDAAVYVRAIIDSYRNAEGLSRIYLAVRVDGKRKRFALDLFANRAHWLPREGRLKKGTPNATGINLLIGRSLARMNDIAIDARIRGERITAESLIERYKTTPARRDDFITWMRAEMERYTRVLSDGTRKNHRTTLKKLEHCFPEGIPFADFDHHVLEEFIRHLHIHGLNHNSRTGHLSRLKIYVSRARREGFLHHDPYVHTTTRYQPGDRESLTRQELHAIEQLEEREHTREFHPAEKPIDGYHRTLRCFLFCCYTGLRISDLDAVQAKNIVNDELRFIPRKTEGMGKVVRIPLSEKAKKYLNRWDEQLRFNQPADQVMNRNLKIIARAAGIRKRLTFHMARHTFATLFLESGGSIEVLQQLLGHADIATTMIYIHVSDRRKREQVERLGYINP